jgi:diguanylate cyclase (GGDEF)-like protein/PAS domain S-box-containing protein
MNTLNTKHLRKGISMMSCFYVFLTDFNRALRSITTESQLLEQLHQLWKSDAVILTMSVWRVNTDGGFSLVSHSRQNESPPVIHELIEVSAAAEGVTVLYSPDGMVLQLQVLSQEDDWLLLEWRFDEPVSQDLYAMLNPPLLMLGANLLSALDWIAVRLRDRDSRLDLIRARDYQHALFEHNAAGILIVDRQRFIVDVNPALCRMLGYEAEELLGKSALEIHHSEAAYRNFHDSFLAAFNATGQVKTAYQFRCRDGSAMWAEILGARTKLMNGEPGVLWSVVDTSDLHQAHEQISYQATHDALTGLPNRRALDIEVENAMRMAMHRHRILAMVMLDMDNFKPINDRWGHEAGDIVLQTVANRLQKVLRRSDFVARLGGDEFVLLLGDYTWQEDTESVFVKIERSVSTPITLQNGDTVSVSMSAGVALFPVHETQNADTLLRYADQALYVSKELKNERARYWAIYGQSLPRRKTEAQRLLESGALQVYYQPVLDGRQRKIVGIEALARLRTADGQSLSPDDFMSDLSPDDVLWLTYEMLRQTLVDLRTLDASGHDLWASVNVHPHSIFPDSVARLQDIFDRQSLNPARITLEILEGGGFHEQQKAMDCLSSLKLKGVRLALDDVGIAYSSLARIKELPVDKIKLDQTFVRALEDKPEDIHFVRSIQELAQGLRMELVVEGVETDAILDAMMVMDVHLIQGYGVAYPMSLEALRVFLQRTMPFSPQYPSTMLGLYAAQFANHSAIGKILMHNAHIFNPTALMNAQMCPIHHAMLRMGIAETDELFVWHNRYHAAVAEVVHELFSVSGSQIGWTSLAEAQQGIDDTLLRLIADGRREELMNALTTECTVL